MRNLDLHVHVFIRESVGRENILSYAVAFAHLHRGQLCLADVRRDVSPWVGEKASDAMISQKNPADAALRKISDQVRSLLEADVLNGFGQMTISQTLSSMALAQAGCERILNTPLPFLYSLLLRRTTYLYCWLLPFALIEATNWFAPVFAAVVAYVFFGL